MVSHSRAENLFWDLVRADQPSSAFAPSIDVEEVRLKLEPLGLEQLVVISTAVNANRVDVGAETDTDRWRVVYFLDNAESVTDVSVWRQPPVFEPIRGMAVVVNGPSGSGKSSLMRAVLEADPRPWVVFDEPWLGEVRQEYLIWPETAPQLHDGYLRGIAALVDIGNLVLVSAAGRRFDSISAASANVATLMVGLYCPLDELIQREHGRDGRAGGLSEASLGDHAGWPYNLTFDTTNLAPHSIATSVLNAVDRETAN